MIGWRTFSLVVTALGWNAVTAISISSASSTPGSGPPSPTGAPTAGAATGTCAASCRWQAGGTEIYWSSVSVTQTIEATVSVIINERNGTTRTVTQLDEDGNTPPETNSAGTRIATITVAGSPTTIVYPTAYAELSGGYSLFGQLSSTSSCLRPGNNGTLIPFPTTTQYITPLSAQRQHDDSLGLYYTPIFNNEGLYANFWKHALPSEAAFFDCNGVLAGPAVFSSVAALSTAAISYVTLTYRDVDGTTSQTVLSPTGPTSTCNPRQEACVPTRRPDGDGNTPTSHGGSPGTTQTPTELPAHESSTSQGSDSGHNSVSTQPGSLSKSNLGPSGSTNDGGHTSSPATTTNANGGQPSNPYYIDGTPLTPGASAVKISGTTYSVVPSGDSIVVNGASWAIPTSATSSGGQGIGDMIMSFLQGAGTSTSAIGKGIVVTASDGHAVVTLSEVDANGSATGGSSASGSSSTGTGGSPGSTTTRSETSNSPQGSSGSSSGSSNGPGSSSSSSVTPTSTSGTAAASPSTTAPSSAHGLVISSFLLLSCLCLTIAL